jgi:hypothetical protein
MSDKVVNAIKSALLSNGWTDPHQCDYGPTADAILAALKAARIAVVELPEEDLSAREGADEGFLGSWGDRQDYMSAWDDGSVVDQDGRSYFPEDLWTLAARSLAAAAAAEAVES